MGLPEQVERGLCRSNGGRTSYKHTIKKRLRRLRRRLWRQYGLELPKAAYRGYEA